MRALLVVVAAAACGQRPVAPRAPADGVVAEGVSGMIVRPPAKVASLPPTAPVRARAKPRTTMAVIPLPDPLHGALPLDVRSDEEQIRDARAEMKRTQGSGVRRPPRRGARGQSGDARRERVRGLPEG
jgi:hypothetical protein